MKCFHLNIAGYRIRFEADADGADLVPAIRFRNYISDEKEYDITILIHSGKYTLTAGTQKVFSAPYVEEVNGIRIKKKDEFWSVYKNNDDLFISTDFPLSPEKKRAILKFSLTSNNWELWFEQEGNAADPMEYPLDGLILYYLTVIHKDIMIHASGISNSGNGYVFSGVSGKGKTTMAKLWNASGAKVIHDDRLIIRKAINGYRMYNTPVYNNDNPGDTQVSRIFIIEHGPSDKLIRVTGANAVSLVMSNCIQHNWSKEIINRLLESVTDLCENVPAEMLYFKPERNVIDYIKMSIGNQY